MNEKLLGKITLAEFGKIKDYPFMIGLKLDFLMDGCGISCGGKYTFNKNNFNNERVVEIVSFIDELLCAAKVNNVSELKGKPVEVTIENNTFKSFRILTEVL